MKYSNCLIEAIKAKIKDPKHIKIHRISLKLNHNRIHFYWTDSEKFYHYVNPNLHTKNLLWFKGVYKVYDSKLFNGIMLCRMEQLNWSVEKKAKVAKKLGMKNCTVQDILEEEELERRVEGQF